jgi:hypothetical protein
MATNRASLPANEAQRGFTPEGHNPERFSKASGCLKPLPPSAQDPEKVKGEISNDWSGFSFYSAI